MVKVTGIRLPLHFITESELVRCEFLYSPTAHINAYLSWNAVMKNYLKLIHTYKHKYIDYPFIRHKLRNVITFQS